MRAQGARWRKWLEQQSVTRAIERMQKRESEIDRLTRLLTPRELEIVRLASEGLRNKEIRWSGSRLRRGR